jgi:hypothetical protein
LELQALAKPAIAISLRRAAARQSPIKEASAGFIEIAMIARLAVTRFSSARRNRNDTSTFERGEELPA